MKLTTETLLQSNNCSNIEKLTAKGGYAYEFYYAGRYRYMKEIDGMFCIDNLQFTSISDMIEYFELEITNGLKPLSERQLYHKYANNREFHHVGDWVDYYVKYLSINHLNHSEDQIKAFYDWRYALTEYQEVPHYNLVK